MRLSAFARIWLCLALAGGSLCGQGQGQGQGTAYSLIHPNPIAPRTALSLDANAREVQDWSFTQGRCTFTLTGKVACFRLGGAVRGLYFQGRGKFRYTTTNQIEFPVVQYNLKHNSYVSPEVSSNAMTFGDGIKEALFWFAGTEVPSCAGPEVPSAASDFQGQLDYFTQVDERPFQHALALRDLKSTAAPYFRAQIRSKSKSWVHVLDALDSERVEVLCPRTFFGAGEGEAYNWAPISRQPIGWDYRHPKSPRFTLTAVDLDLEATSGSDARMKVTETFLPLEAGLTALDLNLTTRYVGNSSPRARTVQYVRVRSVKDADGQPLAFDCGSQGVLVAVPGMKPNVPVTISFEIDGGLLACKRRVDNMWILDDWSWFPLPSELAAQAYTMHATVRVPAPAVPIMGGTTLRRVREGDVNVLETRFDKPVRSFAIIAGNFKLKEETRNGITLRVAGYAGLGPGADHLLKVSAGIIDHYEKLLGPFPFTELNLVDNKFLNRSATGGAPGMLLLGTEAFHPMDYTRMRTRTAEHVNRLVAREISKQYWGQVVKPWSEEDLWLREGFAEYNSVLAVMNMRDKKQGEYDRAVTGWFLDGAIAAKFAPLALAVSLSPDALGSFDWRYRRDLISAKGACLLCRLHKDLGDVDFVRFLRAYQHDLAWRSSTTLDIPVLIQALTGKDETKLFDDCYWGMAMPDRKP